MASGPSQTSTPSCSPKQDVSDPTGRSGVEIGLRGGDVRLVIDPTGARLLSFTYLRASTPEKRVGTSVRAASVSGRQVAILSSGWADSLGARPWGNRSGSFVRLAFYAFLLPAAVRARNPLSFGASLWRVVTVKA